MAKLIPVEVARDASGQWMHPELKAYWNQHLSNVEKPSAYEWRELFNYFQVFIVSVDMESDATDEVLTRYFDNDDIDALAYWNPNPPAVSDNWFLVSIHHNEDGAAAWFARPTGATP